MFSTIYHSLLYTPIFNLLVWLYNVIPGTDLGVSIVVLTIIIRLVLYPVMSSSIKAQKSMQAIQPMMEEVKQKYKDDKKKQAEELMKLYKENKVSPTSSCFPLVVQILIVIALYGVIRDGLTTQDFSALYNFVSVPAGQLKTLAFGFLDLTSPSIPLAVLAGAAQFLQSKMLITSKPPKAAGQGGKDEGMMAMMNKQMLYFMPIITVLIGAKLPAGLTLYWFISTAFTALQQIPIMKERYADKKTHQSESGD